MTPVQFPEVNSRFSAPPDLGESQVMTVPAYVGRVRGGSVDGAQVVVTAWKPSVEELAQLVAGKPLFLSFLGGLPPHFPTVDFHTATHPA